MGWAGPWEVRALQGRSASPPDATLQKEHREKYWLMAIERVPDDVFASTKY